MKNKAGAIIRVSTTRQLEGTSPEKQIEKILGLAHAQGYDIDQKHIWQLAESGGSRERVGFAEALKAGNKGDISRIYVFNIDRLGRDLLEMLLFLRQLDDIGIDCWSAEKGQQLNGNDFLFQIEGAVASKERQEILKRTQDGQLRAIKAGKYCGGIVAYGYRINPNSKQLEIVEDEARVIRMIFNWCVDERMNCIKIADRLNAMGIPTRYKKDKRMLKSEQHGSEVTTGIWRHSRVRFMLRNPAYIGKWEWGKHSKKRRAGETIAGYCPSIIPNETFTKAGEILKQNRLFSKRNSRRKYLLRGLIRCAICGRTFCGSTTMVSPAKVKEITYYQCHGKTQWKTLGRQKCTAPGLRADEIEQVIWDDIMNFCKSPDIVLEQLRSQNDNHDEGIKDTLDQLNAQITELKRQEINLIRISTTSLEANTQMLDELLSENHKARNELISYKATLETQRLQASSLESDLLNVADRLGQLGDRIAQASFEERRLAIEQLVKEILVQPQKVDDGKSIPVVTITYRFNEPFLKVIPRPSSLINNHTLEHTFITN